MLEKIIFTFVGLVAAGITAWLGYTLKRRQRRAVEAEQAALAWLNSQLEVLSRLQTLSTSVTEEPATCADGEHLLLCYEGLANELKTLQLTLNRAFIYVSGARRRGELELQSTLLEQLVEMIGIIIRHHRLHLARKGALNQIDALLETTTSLLDGAVGDPAREVQAEKLATKLEAIKGESANHLETCTATLLGDAERLTSHVQFAKRNAAKVRKTLVA